MLSGAEIVIGCGAAGIELVEEKTVLGVDSLKVAIDLNAVPPAGIGGLSLTDKAKPIGSGVGFFLVDGYENCGYRLFT